MRLSYLGFFVSFILLFTLPVSAANLIFDTSYGDHASGGSAFDFDVYSGLGACADPLPKGCSKEVIYDMTSDTNGAVFQVGQYNQGATYETLVIKYTPEGKIDTLFGAKIYDMSALIPSIGVTGTDFARAVVYDEASNRIIVTGTANLESYVAWIDATTGAFIQGVTVAFSKTGITPFDISLGKTLLPDGSLCGDCLSLTSYGRNSITDDFVAIAVLDQSGTVKFVKEIDVTAGLDRGYSITTDNDGKIVVAGRLDKAMLILWYDAKMDTYTHVSQQLGTSTNQIWDVVVTSENNVITVGYGKVPLAAGGHDLVVTAYDVTHTHWVTHPMELGAIDMGYSVYLDDDESIYATGTTGETNVGDYEDAFLIKFDPFKTGDVALVQNTDFGTNIYDLGPLYGAASNTSDDWNEGLAVLTNQDGRVKAFYLGGTTLYHDGGAAYFNASIAKIRLAGCGDGLLEAGESCDDDNNQNGDGCDASCQIENSSPTPTVPATTDPNTNSTADDSGQTSRDTTNDSLSQDETPQGNGTPVDESGVSDESLSTPTSDNAATTSSFWNMEGDGFGSCSLSYQPLLASSYGANSYGTSLLALLGMIVLIGVRRQCK